MRTICLLLLASLSLILPLSGQQSIGTSYFIWEDANRIDPYYGGNRIVNAQLWYPGEAPEKSVLADYYYAIGEVYKDLDDWSEEDYQLIT